MKTLLDTHHTNLDKLPIVIELGAKKTILGLSGESKPRYIIDSEIVSIHHIKENIFDIKNQLNEKLWSFFRKIFENYLLTNPKDKKILFVVFDNMKDEIQKIITDLMIQKFKLSSVSYLYGYLMRPISLRLHDMLIIDCYENETIILPICDNYPIFEAKVFHSIGLGHLKKKLLEEIIKYNPTINDLSCNYLDSILRKCCFTGKDKNTINATAAIKVPIKVEKNVLEINLPGEIRESIFDVLFEGDDVSLIENIQECISKCPIDCRQIMLSSIFITNSLSNIIGLKKKLAQELNTIYKHTRIIKAEDDLLAWKGASIYSCVSMVENNDKLLWPSSNFNN